MLYCWWGLFALQIVHASPQQYLPPRIFLFRNLTFSSPHTQAPALPLQCLQWVHHQCIYRLSSKCNVAIFRNCIFSRPSNGKTSRLWAVYRGTGLCSCRYLHTVRCVELCCVLCTISTIAHLAVGHQQPVTVVWTPCKLCVRHVSAADTLAYLNP